MARNARNGGHGGGVMDRNACPAEDGHMREPKGASQLGWARGGFNNLINVHDNDSSQKLQFVVKTYVVTTYS